jgi:prepilin-type N-terminal cleavage/methylation domain-containing protein/prepilin-type processing-associated H-X9-DG protein
MKVHPRAIRGFTLIELLVVVAIIAILASLLFPALARSKDKGKTAKCQSNEKQLFLAAFMFEQDNQLYPIGYPGAATPGQIWYRQLQPYLGKKDTTNGTGVFVCPSSFQKVGNATREGGFLGWLAYAQNGAINNGINTISSSSVLDPDGTILYADTDGWDACLYPDGTPGNVCFRHSGGNERSAEMERGVAGRKGAKRRANGIFLDGHVQLLKAAPARIFTLARD